jgi:hypothetical protein
VDWGAEVTGVGDVRLCCAPQFGQNAASPIWAPHALQNAMIPPSKVDCTGE